MTSIVFIPDSVEYTLVLEPDYAAGSAPVCKLSVCLGKDASTLAELMLTHEEILLLAGQLAAIDEVMAREAVKVIIGAD